jgi:catechol 2,3-dioxygenase-like lactoylglutathione lyase family enzyme
MPVIKCHHHGFTVSDAERSITFYRDLLGLELVRVSERKDLPSYDRMLGHDNVVLKVAILCHPVNDFILELVEYKNPVGRKRELDNPFIGSSHLAFEVDDVDAVYRLLKDAGYGAINPPVDVERDGIAVARAMYGLDPDGISIEIFQEFEDVIKK